jgi:hypothetical protein
MKINSKKLLDFLKTQNCEPIFKSNYENCGFLKAGNLEIFRDGDYRKDNGVYSGQIVDFTTLQQSVDRGEKVEVKIVELRKFYLDIRKIGSKTRPAKSLADVIQNFKPTLPSLLKVPN